MLCSVQGNSDVGGFRSWKVSHCRPLPTGSGPRAEQASGVSEQCGRRRRLRRALSTSCSGLRLSVMADRIGGSHAIANDRRPEGRRAQSPMFHVHEECARRDKTGAHMLCAASAGAKAHSVALVRARGKVATLPWLGFLNIRYSWHRQYPISENHGAVLKLGLSPSWSAWCRSN
jgi:hypothetical protein